jgi:hypothetical protein
MSGVKPAGVVDENHSVQLVGEGEWLLVAWSPKDFKIR